MKWISFASRGLYMGDIKQDKPNIDYNACLVGGLEHEFYLPYIGNNHPN
jgi:hypothetical protein